MKIFLNSMMFTPVPYKMTINSYDRYGSEIVVSRKNGIGRFISLFLIVISSVYLCVLTLWKQQSFENVYIISLILTVLFIIHTSFRIHTESLLVLSAIGITCKQCSFLSTTTMFYDISAIKDVVIVEAISKQSVIFQLVLLPKPQSTSSKMDHIYPLLKSFQPHLEDLKTVYRHLQEKLIIPEICTS